MVKMNTRFANKFLFDPVPIDLVGPANTGIPNVHFALIAEKEYTLMFEDIYQVIRDAKSLGMKGLQIDEYDYMYSSRIWEVWFVGSPEDIIMFSLKYKHITTISQEEMTDTLNKASVLGSTYPDAHIDFCYVIARIITKESILIENLGQTRDASYLVDYEPTGTR